MITGNEPAMPSMANFNEEGEIVNIYESGCKPGNVYGLTIRQHFAAIALQGLLSNHSMVDTLSKQAQDVMVQEAVFYADALISELNKTTKTNESTTI